MFDIVFGAALRLDIAIVHPLLKDFNLEKCRVEGERLLPLGSLRAARLQVESETVKL